MIHPLPGEDLDLYTSFQKSGKKKLTSNILCGYLQRMLTQIQLGDIAVDVVQKRIKNIYLRVYRPTGKVRIAAPLRMGVELIRTFAISKLGWIKKQQERLYHQVPQTPVHESDRQPLKEAIQPLIAKWERQMGVTVQKFTVRRMKTRWGTCNPRARTIVINLALAQKPPECLEYVVVHEMVHLQERRHNDRFKQLMDGFMPQWRLRRDELNGRGEP